VSRDVEKSVEETPEEEGEQVLKYQYNKAL
jgi:hypothetical protein